MIIVKNLSKNYGGRSALMKVSFNVVKESRFAIVGENGAGKSTFINILSGFVHKTSGSLGCRSLKLGVMPQDSNLEDRMTCSDFLNLMCLLSDVSRRETSKLLKMVSLGSEKDTKIGSLSHGMRKRLQIAQALIGNPDVLVFDEPISGLDPKVAKSIRELIRRVSKNKTIIYCSHNLGEVEELCDTVLILNSGRVKKIVKISDLTKKCKIIAKYSSKPDFFNVLKRKKYIKSFVYKDNTLEVIFNNKREESKILNLLLTPELMSVKRGVSLESEFLKN
jgi:ABC-2 type transport system ATP-binding protein